MRKTVPALGPGPASRRAGRQAVEGQQDNLEADSAHCLLPSRALPERRRLRWAGQPGAPDPGSTEALRQ